MIRRSVVGPLETNVYAVTGTRGRTVLVDPGAEPHRVLDLVAGLDVRAILLTHAHFDHVLAAGDVARVLGVDVHAHAAEREVWEHEVDHLRRHGHFDAGTATGDLLARDPDLLGAPVAGLWDGRFEPVADGRTWDLGGGVKVTARHVPGHTPGGLAYAVPGAVLTGDTLFPGGPGLTGWPLSDFATIMTSVRQLLREPPDTVIRPGHGRATTVGAERPHVDEWQARGW